MSNEVVAVNQDCYSFNQHILKENNFVCVCYWLNELTGRKTDDLQRFIIQSRLAGCADRLGYASVNHFVESLGEQTSDFTLPCWQVLLDAALETESWYRRESHHFSFLQQIVFPEMEYSRKGDGYRLLSAGCGSGEEAYDLAFECAEHFGIEANWHVDGIDVRSEAVELAKISHWDEADCTVLPERYVYTFFERSFHGFRVSQPIRDKVGFQVANLLQFEIDNQYDVIFCRNLLVEMEKRSGQLLIRKLFDSLRAGGYLVCSHSEKLADYLNADFLLSPNIARKPQI